MLARCPDGGIRILWPRPCLGDGLFTLPGRDGRATRWPLNKTRSLISGFLDRNDFFGGEERLGGPVLANLSLLAFDNPLVRAFPGTRGFLYGGTGLGSVPIRLSFCEGCVRQWRQSQQQCGEQGGRQCRESQRPARHNIGPRFSFSPCLAPSKSNFLREDGCFSDECKTTSNVTAIAAMIGMYIMLTPVRPREAHALQHLDGQTATQALVNIELYWATKNINTFVLLASLGSHTMLLSNNST